MSQLIKRRRTVSIPSVRTTSTTRNGKGKSSRSRIPFMTLSKELAYVQNQIHNVVMSCAGSFSLNNSTGFAAISPSCVFAFTAQNVVYSLGGGAYLPFSYNFANAASFQAVYDQYRIRKVVCEITYSSNQSLQSSSIQLPHLYGIIDYNDGDAITNQAEALSYSSCKFMQLGNSSGPNNGVQYMTNYRPTTQMSASTTTLGTTTGSVARISPWIDTDALTVEHLGMKFWTDTPGATAVTSGYVQWTFRVFIDYKNVN